MRISAIPDTADNGLAMSKFGHLSNSRVSRKAEQSGPTPVHFRRPEHGAAAIETLSLTQLRQRANPGQLASLQRLEFLQLMLYTRGQGRHLVDFVSYPVQPDTLIIVQPGSVHRFELNEAMDAQLLVIDPVFMLPERLAWLKPLLVTTPWPSCTVIPPALRDEFLELCRQLNVDAKRSASPALRAALARQRLYTLLLLLRIEWDRSAGRDRLEASPDLLLSAAFRDLLEVHYPEHWTVQDYARRLGYAERTLTRACHATSGRSAKAMIDERVLLEAKRLLVHSNDSVEAIALRLGFGGASPLVQFFRRLSGVTPGTFRLGFPDFGTSQRDRDGGAARRLPSQGAPRPVR